MNGHSQANFAEQYLQLCLHIKANSCRLNANFARKNLMNNAYTYSYIVTMWSKKGTKEP